MPFLAHDAALFNLNTRQGSLSSRLPDFENPADQGGDNVYNVIITASDALGNSTAQIANWMWMIQRQPSSAIARRYHNHGCG